MFKLLVFILLVAASVFISGCGTSVSLTRWRDDASARFNTALSAGVEVFAPEETDNIRQTVALAERYYKSAMFEDADRLYQLSCQKSQLLYRNLVVSKIRHGATVSVERERGGDREDDKGEKVEELLVANTPVSLKQIVQAEIDDEDTTENDDETDKNTLDKKVEIQNKKDVVSQELKQVTIQKPIKEEKQEVSPIRPPKAKIEKPVFRSSSITPKVTAIARPPIKISKKIPLPQTLPHSKAGTKLYLTFDDGPSRLTLPIASYLVSQGVKATFFVLGSNIKGREKVLTSVVTMGHRVGNHTLSHNLHKLNASFKNSNNEVKKTADMIDRLGGDGKLVRIPYGASNKTIAANVAAEGAQIFDWDIDSRDSTHIGSKNHQVIENSIIKHLRTAKKRHLVLLFHDGAGHDSTLTAIKSLLPRLKQEGYAFGLLARHESVAMSSTQQKNIHHE